jgi:hypothetical protein
MIHRPEAIRERNLTGRREMKKIREKLVIHPLFLISNVPESEFHI